MVLIYLVIYFDRSYNMSFEANPAPVNLDATTDVSPPSKP